MISYRLMCEGSRRPGGSGVSRERCLASSPLVTLALPFCQWKNSGKRTPCHPQVLHVLLPRVAAGRTSGCTSQIVPATQAGIRACVRHRLAMHGFETPAPTSMQILPECPKGAPHTCMRTSARLWQKGFVLPSPGAAACEATLPSAACCLGPTSPPQECAWWGAGSRIA